LQGLTRGREGRSIRRADHSCARGGEADSRAPRRRDAGLRHRAERGPRTVGRRGGAVPDRRRRGIAAGSAAKAFACGRRRRRYWGADQDHRRSDRRTGTVPRDSPVCTDPSNRHLPSREYLLHGLRRRRCDRGLLFSRPDLLSGRPSGWRYPELLHQRADLRQRHVHLLRPQPEARLALRRPAPGFGVGRGG
jgi:hypothetical protein